LKVADLIGFAALLYAGYLYGTYNADESAPFTNEEYAQIGGLVVVGFYFSVVLS
jgi:hypothetical protein